MYDDVAPNFINRSKATSVRLQPNGIYVAIVTRVTGTATTDRIYVKVPKLGGINEYGPCVVAGVIPSVNDFVLVGFLDNKMSELVSFGTFSQHPPSNDVFGTVTNLLAPKESPTFTGTVTIPAGSSISLPNINNIKLGYTTTVTSAGTTTLTNASNNQQVFTGATTQTVVMPVATTMTVGTRYLIENNSTGTVTVNSSGGNLISTVLSGSSIKVTSILASGTTAASWDAEYVGFDAVTGTGANVLAASPTLTGTVTLPSTTSIGTVTNTELSYVDGVTSSIQTQIDTKLNKTRTIINNPSATLTLDATHISAIVECSSGSATTVTIPAEATYNFPIGTEINISWVGSASTVRVARASTAITANGTNSPTSYFYLRAQWSTVTLFKRGSNSWHVFGDFYVG
jgi:hypothetical protein